MFKHQLESKLKDLMESASKESNYSGFSLGLYSANINISIASGLDDRVHKTMLRPDSMLVWGSVTKMYADVILDSCLSHYLFVFPIRNRYTSASILRQVERGRLQLDEPLAPIIDPWLDRRYGMKLSELFGKEVNIVSPRNVIQMASG